MKGGAKRITVLAAFTAISLVMFTVESLIPTFIPGAKIGLSNVFTLLALFLLGPYDAVILVVVRTVLGSIIGGNLSAIMYSLTAGIVSLAVSVVLYRFAFGKVSITALSVSAAVVHNIVQTAVFCLVTGTTQWFYYLVYLVPIGIISGLCVGVITLAMIKYIPVSFFEKYIVIR
ncbi:MAG TPA: Gx transporter family protein [Clostridia bacterium]|nr:Gx transporter family protein [Clostridia bacterium]